MKGTIKYVGVVVASVLSVAMAFSMSASASARPTVRSAPLGVGAPKHGGSVTDLVNGGEWPGLDPATNTQDTADSTENNAIFGQLFELGPGNAILDDEATGYKYFNHNLSVAISIRPGIKFQDGTPMTAPVVAWSIERDLTPAYACLCDANFEPVTSITTKGKYTVILNMSFSDAAIISAFINYAPNWTVDEADFNSVGAATFQQHPMGAGPFEVVSNAASSLLVLKRYTGYWNKGRPYIDNLTFQSTGSDNSDLDALESGEGQYSVISTLSLVPVVKSNKSLRFIETPSTTVEFVQLNEKIAPFNNLTARQALQYATNAEQLCSSLYYNVYRPVEGFTAPGMLFYQKNIPGFDAYNPQKAESLISTLPGGQLSFTLDSTTNTLFWLQEGDALAQQWAAVGIKASVVLDSLQNFLQKLGANNWTAITANWGSFDPGVALPTQFASDGLLSGTHDPTLDGLMNQGLQFINPSTRARVYLKIDEYMDKQAVAVFEYYKPGLTVTTSNLEGITQFGGIVQWQNVWLK